MVGAEREIRAFFRNAGDRAYQRRDLERIFREHAQAWRLDPHARPRHLIDFLLERGLVREIELASTASQYRPKTRYAVGSPSAFSVALSLAEGGYLSHGTAVFLHQLSDQIPTMLFVNREQSPKPSNPHSLTQESLDRAFRAPQRRSRYVFRHDDFQITLLSGKHTGRLEVQSLPYPPHEKLDVTSIERTLIDIAVRPDYAGGVFQELAAYRGATDVLSVNKLLAVLKKLDYVYPYHQAIGFYLERAGQPPKRLEPFRRLGLSYDFHLAHGVREPAFDASWRVFHPKGL